MSCNILFSTVWLSSVLRYSFSAKTAMAFHHSRKLSGLSALFRLGCSGNRNGRKIRCLLAATESPSWIMKENDGTVGGYAFGSFLEEHSGMSPFLEPMKIRFENCGSIVSGSSGGKSLPYKKTSESIACYKLCGNFSGMDTRQAAPESGAACLCGGRFG